MSGFKSEVLGVLKKFKKGFLCVGLGMESNLIQKCIQEGDYEAAIDKCKKVLVTAKEQGYEEHKAPAYLKLGVLYFVTDNYEHSINNCEEYLKLTSHVDDDGKATANKMLGASYHKLGQQTKAILYYEKALKLRKDHGGDQKSEIAKITCELEIAYRERGQYKQAIAKLQEAIQLLSDDAEHTNLRYKLNLKLGFVYKEVKQYQEAAECLHCALRLAKELKDEKKRSKAYNFLAGVKIHQGKLEDTIKYLNKWRKIAYNVGDRAEIAEAKRQLGYAYKIKDEPKKAIEFYDGFISDSHQSTDKLILADAYISKGNAHKECEQHELAIQSCLKALQLLKKLRDEGKYEECEAQICLGDVYFNRSQYEYAKERYHLAWTIADAKDYKKIKGRVDIKLGNVLYRQNNAQDACRYYHEAQVIGKSLDDKQMEADAYTGLGCASQSNSDYPGAVIYHVESLQLAIELKDSKRNQKGSENLGQTYFALEQWLEAAKTYSISCEIANRNHDTEAVYRCEKNMGKAYYEMKDYDKAIPHFQRCFDIKTPMNDDAELYKIVASCHREIGQPQMALEFYEKYLEAVHLTMSSTVATVRLEVGKLHEELGDCNKAIELYKKCLNDLDDLKVKLEVLERLGDVYCRKALPDDACNDLKVKLEVLERLGDVYSREALPDDACNDLKVKLEVLERLGDVYCRKALPDDACKYYQKIVDHRDLVARGKRCQIYYKIGQIFACRLKKPREAIRRYYQALDDVEDVAMNADIYEALGLASCMNEDYKGAIAYHNKSLEFVEDDERRQRAYENLGDACRASKEWLQAISHYEHSCEIAKRLDDKTGLQARCERKLGFSYYEDKQYHKAIELLEKACQDAQAGEIYLVLGHSHAKVGSYDKAVEYFCKELQNAKDAREVQRQVRVLGYIGRVYVKSDRFQDAIEYHEKALNIVPKLNDKLEANIYCNLGCAYKANSQYEEAMKNQKKFLQIGQHLNDKSLQRRAHKKIGNIYYAIACKHGNISEEMKSEETKLLFRECTRSAIDSYEASLKLLESTDKPATVRVLGKLGCTKRGIGQLQKAIDCHKIQLKRTVDLKDRVSAFENLIIDYELNGDYDEALKLQEEYFEAAEKLGGQSHGQAYVNIAKVHLAKGEYKEAIRKAESAEKMDNTAVKAEAYGVMGCAYTGQGQYKTARDMHQDEMRVVGSNDESGRARAEGNIGLAHMGAGDYKDTIAFFRRQMESMQDKREEGRLNENFGNYYAAIGECSKAITYYDKFLKIAEEIGDKAAIGRAKACKGTAFTEMGQYQNALECHEEEKEIAKKLKNEVREGQALGNLGDVYTNLCDYQRAIEHHKESLRIAEKHGVQVDQRRANANLANAYMARGADREAQYVLSSALAIAEQLGHRAAEGRIYESMAKAYYFRGKFNEAVEFGEKSASIAREVGDKAGEGRALGTLGNARVELGKNQQACFDLRKYLEISKELANEADEADSLTSLAVVYIEIEQYDKAEKCCQESLQIARKIEDKARQGRSYEALGKFYTAVGKYKDAIKNHKEHLKIAEELKDKVAIGKSNGNLGIAYIKTCEYKKALECQKIDKRVAVDLGNTSRVGRAQGNMGKTYTLTGQFEKAINCHLKHLKIAEELGDKRSLAQALHGLGLNYIKVGGHLEKAKTRLEQLLEMSRPISEGATAIAQQLLGQCYRGEKDACIFFAKSIINFQGARNSVRDHDEFNISMSNSFANVYKLLFQSLLELNEVNTALLASDYGKAQALFDLRREVAFRGFKDQMMLSDPMETIATDPSSINSKNLLNDKLFNVIGNRQADTVVSYAFGENGELHAWVICGEGVFHQTLLKRESSAKSYLSRQIFFFKDNLNLRGTQDDDNEGGNFGSATSSPSFLSPSFSMSEDNESVESDKEEAEHFAVKHSSFDHNDSSSTPASVVTRKGGATSTAKAEQNTYDSYLRDLYAILIEPIEPHLTGSKLLIVPDEALWTLPFAALLDPSGRHLCDKYSLQFIPSLHVLDLCLSQLPGSELGPALFVGNPKTDAKRQLKSLAFAEKEATTCGTYFNAQVLIGDKATKKNVLGGMKRGSIIHIAAHGCEGRADIVLTPDEESASDLLTDEDILKCSLCARLVVLSCCFSGRGEISPEGVVGIARSFLGSGARAVLVALWQINDEGAMEFMVEFYKNLVQEYPVCTAVQQAMIALKRRYPLNVWALFLVIGEDIKFTKDEIESIRHQSDPK